MRERISASRTPRHPVAESGKAANKGRPPGGSPGERGARSPLFVFADPGSEALVRLLARIAPSDLPIMITGEVGTGKEEVARYVHQLSGRGGAFLRIDCVGLADDFVDRTGPSPKAAHWLEAARGGTLFLDEPAALPSGAQEQILALLQEQDPVRGRALDVSVGDTPHARLIAATSVDVSEVITAGHFRLELFYRLNAVQAHLLPLRRRRGDIAPLAENFLRIYAAQLSLPSARLTPEALVALAQHSWPGNVAELRHVIHAALLLAPEGIIRAEQLRLTPLVAADAPAAHAGDSAALPSQHEGDTATSPLVDLLLRLFRAPRPHLMDDLERLIVAEALQFTHCNQVRTAALLGISRNVLRTLMKKHDLYASRVKSGGMLT